MNIRYFVFMLCISLFVSCSSDSSTEEQSKNNLTENEAAVKVNAPTAIVVSKKEEKKIEEKVEKLIDEKLNSGTLLETKGKIDIDKQTSKDLKTNIKEKKTHFKEGIIKSKFYKDIACCTSDFTSECCCNEVLSYYESRYNLYLKDSKYAAEISDLNTKDKIVRSCLESQSSFKEKIEAIKKQKPERQKEKKNEDEYGW